MRTGFGGVLQLRTRLPVVSLPTKTLLSLIVLMAAAFACYQVNGNVLPNIVLLAAGPYSVLLVAGPGYGSGFIYIFLRC
jgi:hypothetical protein